MSRTYLALCQELARDLRIPGSGPSTVSGQTGELEKVVRYIKNADLDVKRRWIDWNFLWAEFSSTTVADSTSLLDDSPSDLREWDLRHFTYDPTSDNFVRLSYMEYDQFRDRTLGTQTSSTPSAFTVRPDKTLRVYPPATEAKTLSGEYWKTGVTLTSDSDTSEIPETHDRIIIVRAKLYYAEAEDAPEIMASALSEHEDLINNLEASEHPDQRNRIMSRARDNEPIRSA